jgi:hypothetical protein
MDLHVDPNLIIEVMLSFVKLQLARCETATKQETRNRCDVAGLELNQNTSFPSEDGRHLEKLDKAQGQNRIVFSA